MLDMNSENVLGLYWTKTMIWWVMAVDLTMDLDYRLYVWIVLGYRTLYGYVMTLLVHG